MSRLCRIVPLVGQATRCDEAISGKGNPRGGALIPGVSSCMARAGRLILAAGATKDICCPC